MGLDSFSYILFSVHLEICHVYTVIHSTEGAAHWPKAVYLNFHKVFASSITNHSEIQIKTLPEACFLPFKFKIPGSHHSSASQEELRFPFKLKLLGCSVVNTRLSKV